MALCQMTIMDLWEEVCIVYFFNILDMTDVKLLLKFLTDILFIVFSLLYPVSMFF